MTRRGTVPGDVSTGGGGGSGDVTGPASSTDNAITRFNGATGKVIQNSLAILGDAGEISTPVDITVFNGSARQLELGEELIEVISTGLYAFAGLTIGIPATGVDVGAGAGHVINSHDDPNPANWTYTSVSWGASTVAITAVATPGITYLYVDSAGAIQQTTTPLTQEQRRENIFLGRAIHTTGSGTVIQVQNTPDVVLNATQQLGELMDNIGIINPNVTVGAASTNLTIATGGGTLVVRGAGFVADAARPNDVDIASASPITFRYIDQDTAGTVDTTNIDPTLYDNAGTPTAIPGSSSRASIQRIYVFPSGAWRVAYGQAWYNSLAEAIQSIQTEAFVTNPFVSGNGILVGVLVVTSGATDLSDTSTAKFFPASRFGGASVGAAGASVSTLQNAYDNSTGSNATILTNSTLGAVKAQRGSAADTDDVLEVLNNAGTQTFGVTGNGAITAASKLTLQDSATTPPLNLVERASPPSTPASGDLYLDDGTNTASGNPGWRRYTGAVWEDVGATAGGGGGSTFLDNAFRVQDNTDNTKQLAFECSGITTATTRTGTVPDADFNLGSFEGSSFADNQLIRSSGTTGRVIQNSVITIADAVSGESDMANVRFINEMPIKSAERISGLSNTAYYDTPSTGQWAGNGTAFTVAVLVRWFARISSNYHVLAMSSDDFSRGWRLEYESDNFRFRLSGSTSSTSTPAVCSVAGPKVGQYYLIHGVYDGVNAQQFVNAHPCSATAATFTANSVAQPGVLGQVNSGASPVADVVGFAFWGSTALSQTQISDHADNVWRYGYMVDDPNVGCDNLYNAYTGANGAAVTWTDEVGAIDLDRQGSPTSSLCRIQPGTA